MSPWIWAFPTCGCLLVICVLVSGVAALFASGRATEIGTAWGAPRLPRPWEGQAPVTSPTRPSVGGQPTPRPTIGGYPSPVGPAATPRPPIGATSTPSAATGAPPASSPVTTTTPSVSGPIATTTPSAPTAAPPAAGSPVVTISQVARLTGDGQRQPVGNGAQNVVVPADNRGVAVRVQFQQVPSGFTGQLIVAWSRVGATPSALRAPEATQVTDVINDTTWWFSYRSDDPLPPGQYEFSIALAPAAGGAPTRQTVRFEVR
ncbi:MAG: hypothetical protein NZ518_01790 [Dehalococcoidia bacterium]|nr:hypothetical protein [Dehalococcoidia bacterium]